MSVGLGLYRLGTALAEPFLPYLLDRRLARGKEDATRLAERFGRASLARPPGPLVWLHAASVGETNAILPLIARLGEMRPDLALLLTSGTVTSARLAGQRLPPGVLHQFVPVDSPSAVSAFLAHWRPDLGLVVESELWPRLLEAARAGGTRLVLVNARMSERSHRRWRFAPGVVRRLVALFDLIAAQSEADAARFEALGGHVEAFGNLKFDSAPPPADPGVLDALRRAVDGRPVLAAASTHAGEEALVAEMHRILAPHLPGLLTLLAPRHPERGAEVAAIGHAAGLSVSRRSEGVLPEPSTAFHVVDTLGELGLVYRLAGAAFVGGSLVPHGGQSPIEPAKLDCPILYGPHVGNFRDVYSALDAAGGAMSVTDAVSLADGAGALLTDRELARRQAAAARAVVDAGAGALDRLLAAIEPLLPARAPAP